MKRFSDRKDNDEQEILENLQSDAVSQRKGEEKLFASYSYLIKAGIWKYSICEDDAFDAYSDTVLAAIYSITRGAFLRECSLTAYLNTIFHYKCVDMVRKKAAHKNIIYKTVPISVEELRLSCNTKSIIEKIIMKSDFNLLIRKLNQLNDTSRKVLLLFADGYRDKEIATALQIEKREVVKTMRYRCLRRLRMLVLKSHYKF